MRIIDADMHLRDEDGEIRRYLRPPWNAGRRTLYPFDNFDRTLGGRLGRPAQSPQAHLEDMEAEAIDVAVLYPTNGLFIGEVRERAFAVALTQAYNEWVARFCETAPERLKAVAMVPIQDPDAAARELERAVRTLGLVGAMVPTFCRVGPRNPGDRWLDPLYAVAEMLGVPVALHASGGVTAANDRFATFLEIHAFSHVPEQMAALTAVVLGGVLERFPRLKVGFMEAGCGWVPFWLEHLDEEYALRREEADHLRRAPSDYVRTGAVYFGVEPEEQGIRLAAECVGPDRLLYASDYPHWDSGWPNTSRCLRERTDLSEQWKTQLLGENAARFYGL
ncbi:MAG: amidohydrolase [Firmicutes bacterium]|nr:amidohydrolase [Alicyclobacillaceae bacterium]MCL6496018.1 amidohydrolase [Bacillota bacterium]